MSLFGTSPDDLPSRPKSSLFDDEPTPAGTSSLFADETSTSADSPWAFPTPKKAARGNLIKTLLPAGDVPDSYIDVYDSLLSSGDKVGGGVSLAGVKRLLSASKLDADNQAKILNIVVPGGQETNLGLGRGEFNVLLALIGLAQEGEDVALDGVDERRRIRSPRETSAIRDSEDTSYAPDKPEHVWSVTTKTAHSASAIHRVSRVRSVGKPGTAQGP
ncbi:Sorting nexin mvp1 [Cryomyces antarcticus]|uniref:Sorting nexin mvp1 n=1 Tax=Cryomyces antarcticus TaxID=329879 RepID=A0ABR0LVK4_9PEZI|nr:Sorting nexin mvp1 [Cryomyces antarcticus]KAK5246855.1 Sorting nexin mvp1 [Cryomyces antarcticus]